MEGERKEKGVRGREGGRGGEERGRGGEERGKCFCHPSFL